MTEEDKKTDVTTHEPKPEPQRKALVQTGERSRPLIATDMESAFRMATAFAASGMLPKSYYSDGKEAAAGKAFTAMQIGAEVGLLPMQAIQSIAVVNGNATIWGDTQKGLVENSGLCEYIHESYDGELYIDDKTVNPAFKAICVTKRVGRDEVREEFTQADAKRAGLWGKQGPWTTHPKRMMRYKVRAFTLRDVYPDVLKGLVHSREEMEGEMVDVTPSSTITPANPVATLENNMKRARVSKRPQIEPAVTIDDAPRPAPAEVAVPFTEVATSQIGAVNETPEQKAERAMVEDAEQQDAPKAEAQAEGWSENAEFSLENYNLEVVAGITKAANDLLALLKTIPEKTDL